MHEKNIPLYCKLAVFIQYKQLFRITTFKLYLMKNSIDLLNRAANNIRILAAATVERANSGHPGGAMGGADFINVLFSEYLTYDPANPYWKCRDRFFLDPGHMSPMLYSVLALSEKFTLEELQNFRRWGSPTTGHPELDVQRGIENTSGPLGQGHVFAVGAAIAAKFLATHLKNDSYNKERIYAYISDGGIQEEISQGAGRMAGHLGLNNLIMFYDSNDIQLSTECNAVTSENTAMKYRAWNWNVITINGNDANEIRQALDTALEEKERPTLIIGKCIMGKGARKEDNSSYERNYKTHGAPLGGEAFRNTVINLGGNPDNPFVIFDKVKDLYEERKNELKDIVGKRYAEEVEWAKSNPLLAKKEESWFSGKIESPIQWNNIEVKSGMSTREASRAVLSELGKSVENLIVSSADLSNSDRTDGYLKQTQALAKGDFSGKFLQAGVSELTMACVCIGIQLHGGVTAACGTFFVFSDYMKPAVRMAALMGVPVKFIWSHDSFRVGEDGPTHEPIEQEAQIRLMEKVHNHKGQPSLLALRPADTYETISCWKIALENTQTPTAIILTRQNIKDLPQGTKYAEASKGGYLVHSDNKPEIVLIASGSEVSTLAEVGEMLQNDGIQYQLASIPSEGLFRTQTKEYQQEILPTGIKRFGLTAGLPVNLEGLVGDNGYVYGVNTFGFSAPYKILDEKLGFTPTQVYQEIKKFLEK